jgi:hypothetical protein
MTRIVRTPRAKRAGVAYFVRRSSDGSSVIKVHPDREEIVASGLEAAAAENQCVSKIDQMRIGAAPPLVDLADNPGPRSGLKPRRGVRQLAFEF